jgi:hypothetical protein
VALTVFAVGESLPFTEYNAGVARNAAEDKWRASALIVVRSQA